MGGRVDLFQGVTMNKEFDILSRIKSKSTAHSGKGLIRNNARSFADELQEQSTGQLKGCQSKVAGAGSSQGLSVVGPEWK